MFMGYVSFREGTRKDGDFPLPAMESFFLEANLGGF